MATKIMILNGPNLNFLGIREPHIYGPTTLKEIEASCEELAKYLGVTISFHQSNLEGELVNWIQSAHGNYDAIIMNPAAYSFTSIALIDALKIFEGPKIEVHISNIHARDELHRHSITSSASTAVICGLGPYGYIAAMLAAVQKLGSCRMPFRPRCTASRGDRKMRGAGFLAIWSDVEPDHLTDYRHWLTREHTTERVTTKGFLGVRVFRATRADIARFFILYELESPEVLDGPAYLARLNAPTPWSQRTMPQLGNFIRGGGVMTARAGRGEGSTIVALRIERLPPKPQHSPTRLSRSTALPRCRSARPIWPARRCRRSKRACGRTKVFSPAS